MIVFCLVAGGGSWGQTCSPDRLREALRTLRECGFADPLGLALQEDRASCVEQLLRVAVPTDTSAVETACRPGVRGDCWRHLIDNYPGIGYSSLVAACQPGTTGDCLEVLLERGRPANDEGWREMGQACSYVSGACARLFVSRYQLDVNHLEPFHRFCSVLAE
jgi:hypothetical protein